jgi:ribosomal peptide maturation radical SAM protein 1
MPFAGANRPSIQCGLLKGVLSREGHAVDVHYLNLELAAELGARLYAALAELRTDQMLGEWLFSAAAFGHELSEADYLEAHPSIAHTCEQLDRTFEDLCELRRTTVPAWLERCETSVDWGAYALVGFTSTFEQNVASLALAARIKARHPHVVTVFGGANYDDTMGPEFVRAFDSIDYAVVGEGERALAALAGCVARGEVAADVPGVVGRTDGELFVNAPADLLRDLDGQPDPDYDDFFAALARLGRERVLADALPLLPFESARGCWWGEKHHCTFCGLNANGMAYRSKSPGRVHEEMRRMSARYQIANFEAVDNILDMRYLNQLCEPLIAERTDYRIFYEVKSNLRREQLSTLSRAGVRLIQPGIESLSTHILKLMRKGSTGLLNVRLLKWAHYYGIGVAWNLLTGFPGERLEDYAEQERWLRRLVHLPPPSGGGPIWMERFSPYFSEPGFPVSEVTPWPAYRFVYPEAEVDLSQIAYFFSYTMADTIHPKELATLFDALKAWQKRWTQTPAPSLVYQRTPDWIQIVDQRDAATPRVSAFSGLEAAVYEACGDTYRTAGAIADELNRTHGAGCDADAIAPIVARFCDEDLMIEEDGRYLSLALPVNVNW